MITNEMIKTIKNIHRCLDLNLTDELDIYIDTISGGDIGEALLSDDAIMSDSDTELVSYQEVLKWFIDFCSYVENETDVPAIISDELYDKLVEKLVDMGAPQPIGSQVLDGSKEPHSYPELRGSLSKVHYIWEKDIPPKDSRKSLEGYLNNVIRLANQAGIPINDVLVSIDLKYDGVSHIIECSYVYVDKILTRGDVDTNLGKDLTELFMKFFPLYSEYSSYKDIYFKEMVSSMGLDKLPKTLFDDPELNYGIKVETFMHTDDYQNYVGENNIKRCNRRSAVTSICNQDAGNVEYQSHLKDYLSMSHFQIASDTDLYTVFTKEEQEHWIPIGKINDRYQYLYVENPMYIDLSIVSDVCNLCNEYIGKLKKEAEEKLIPIDGIVISLLDKKLVELLGRNNDKNMFQVAFKFPAGEEKTIIEKVDFQVGPIAGNLTPVARLKPIKINGNTITNVTISNKAKMDRLQIHEGDEVIIKYDIIPTIFKDSSCKCSDSPLITFPTKCPVCSGDVEEERCINPDCPAKIVGHILNFVKKNRIDGGIGFNTIVDFVERGYLNSIGDLYRLYRYKDELCEIPGYGEMSVTKILSGISESRKMYPHQIFGTIGIPSIGLKTMEKVCRNLDLIGNLGNIDGIYPLMVNISGIGDKKAKLICEGIKNKINLVQDLCSNLELKPYPKGTEITEVVCFTNVRDKEFEKFLEDKGIGVSSSLTSKVTTLIIPDWKMSKESSKYKEAKERDIEILKLSEAFDKWGYEGGI